ncbi:MAG: N-acetyltransferase [Planctomycetota bacterium]|nr:MAG: N-acetyltransferase [Planctomycetota bacterium]
MKTLDLQPHLVGELVELRPIAPSDWEALYQAASDPKVWEQHPVSDRYREDVFRGFFADAIASKGALVAIDRRTGTIIGSSRYDGYDPERSEVEIGWTFLARAYWGGRYNGEMKRLMLEHAFGSVERVLFLVGDDNVRSKKALEKIGAHQTDRHKAMTVGGKVYDHVVFEIARAASQNGADAARG